MEMILAQDSKVIKISYSCIYLHQTKVIAYCRKASRYHVVLAVVILYIGTSLILKADKN